MKILEIFNVLDGLSEPEIIFLEYKNSYQLLIGVILSAQTTDRQVNSILPELFNQYPAPADLAEAELKDIIRIIRPLGFFNMKAGNIKKTAKMIHEKYNDTVPESMNELLKLAGVGRKSANVIRGACFNLPAIIVDTHFSRTSKRLGLTNGGSPEAIERELSKTVPPKIQYRFSMLLNKLGREYCHSRKPECRQCPVKGLCNYTA